MECPHCESKKVNKRGFDKLQDGSLIQRYQCKECGKRFNERTGTAMARLRTSSSLVSYAINARTEGMGVRATGRTFGKSHSTMAQSGYQGGTKARKLIKILKEPCLFFWHCERTQRNQDKKAA